MKLQPPCPVSKYSKTGAFCLWEEIVYRSNFPPAFQQVIFLADLFCEFDKSFRSNRVEFEYFIMAGDHRRGVDLLSKLRGFPSAEVACDAAPRVAPIDGKQGKINFPVPKLIHQIVMRDAVPAVTDCPGAGLHNEADETVITVFILLERFVGGRDRLKNKGMDLNRLTTGAWFSLVATCSAQQERLAMT